MLHFDNTDDLPATYAGVRGMILNLLEQGPVFARDMSYYVMPELLDDEKPIADFDRLT